MSISKGSLYCSVADRRCRQGWEQGEGGRQSLEPALGGRQSTQGPQLMRGGGDKGGVKKDAEDVGLISWGGAGTIYCTGDTGDEPIKANWMKEQMSREGSLT